MLRKHLSSARNLGANRFFSTSIIFVVLSLLSAALNYAYYPVIARFLSLEEFGAAQSLITITLQLGAIFSGLNLVTIYIVRVNPAKDAKLLIELMQRLAIAFFVAAAIVVSVFSEPIQSFLHIDNSAYLLLVSLNMIATVPFIVAFGSLQAHKKFVTAGFLQLTLVSVKLLAGLLLVARYGVAGALAGFAVGQILGMAIFWLVARWRRIEIWSHNIVRSLLPPSPSQLRRIGPQWSILGTVFSINVILAFLISIDVLAARHYFSPDLSGLYAGASTIANIVIFISLPLISVLLPHLDMASARRSAGVFGRTLGLVSLVAIGCVTVFAIAPDFVLSIFGQEYTEMSYLLWKLGVMMSLAALATLALQTGAFFAPRRSALITALSFGGLLWVIGQHHSSPEVLVTGITAVFAGIVGLGFGQLIWIFAHEKTSR